MRARGARISDEKIEGKGDESGVCQLTDYLLTTHESQTNSIASSGLVSFVRSFSNPF